MGKLLLLPKPRQFHQLCLSCNVTEILASNTGVTLKYGLWLVQGNRKWHQSQTIDHMAVFCAVFKIKQDICGKCHFFIPFPFNLSDHLEPLRLIFQNFNTNCSSP